MLQKASFCLTAINYVKSQQISTTAHLSRTPSEGSLCKIKTGDYKIRMIETGAKKKKKINECKS